MERNVLEMLERSAQQYSTKVAVKDENGHCTFAQLCMNAKRIGTALCQFHITGKVIPVFMEKGIPALETFFGIVYAGAAYSLMNPIQPAGRIESILERLDAPVIITDKEHLSVLESMNYSGKALLTEDLISGEVQEELLQDIRSRSIDMAPLYVNFTSGSTGVPKGVVVGHQSVIEFIHYFVDLFGITSEDIIGNQAPFDFDVSVKDIYSMLLSGATMYIIPREAFSFPMRLLDLFEEERITTLIWAVSALCQISSLGGFTYKKPETVNKVIYSGEVMPVKHLEIWSEALPDTTFINVYGPTEITCNCTYYIYEKGKDYPEGVPVGKPFPNEKVFLLDEQQREVTEPGVEGEICVAGSTLALGYYKDPEKTRNAFIQNPLNDSFPERIYCTGDIGKYQSDGNLVYIGRKDFQIKHMGHRIELLEIEAHISAIEGIERVCCLYNDQQKQIVAVYQGDVERKTIKSVLKQKVVRYMIPDKIIRIEQMPLTANGKIDRKQLMKDYFEE